MTRAKSSVARRKRRKKFLKKAKGFRGGKSKLYRTARESSAKALAYATRDRRQKKREFRKLWTVRINAACRKEGISYSKFINGLSKASVKLDRKVLADLAVSDPAGFKVLVDTAKKQLQV